MKSALLVLTALIVVNSVAGESSGKVITFNFNRGFSKKVADQVLIAGVGTHATREIMRAHTHTCTRAGSFVPAHTHAFLRLSLALVGYSRNAERPSRSLLASRLPDLCIVVSQWAKHSAVTCRLIGTLYKC